MDEAFSPFPTSKLSINELSIDCLQAGTAALFCGERNRAVERILTVPTVENTLIYLNMLHYNMQPLGSTVIVIIVLFFHSKGRLTVMAGLKI